MVTYEQGYKILSTEEGFSTPSQSEVRAMNKFYTVFILEEIQIFYSQFYKLRVAKYKSSWVFTGE